MARDSVNGHGESSPRAFVWGVIRPILDLNYGSDFDLA